MWRSVTLDSMPTADAFGFLGAVSEGFAGRDSDTGRDGLAIGPRSGWSVVTPLAIGRRSGCDGILRTGTWDAGTPRTGAWVAGTLRTRPRVTGSLIYVVR